MLGVSLVFLIALRSCLRSSSLREEKLIAAPGSRQGPTPIHSVRGLLVHIVMDQEAEEEEHSGHSPFLFLSCPWDGAPTHSVDPLPSVHAPQKVLCRHCCHGSASIRWKVTNAPTNILHLALSPVILLLLILKQSLIKFWREALNLWSSCFSLLESWPFATRPRRFSISYTLLLAIKLAKN